MLISVAICTRDRAPSLRRTLASLAECARLPGAGDAWELIVVDNGSGDDTAFVVASFAAHLPVRLVREDAAGLSNARNTAVHAALGDYVVWTDDDCIVDPQFLSAYAAAFREHPTAVVFGGPIVPRFDGTPPAWLTRVATRVGAAYAARDLGGEAIALGVNASLIPFGANYAIRAAEQRTHRYDVRLGRGSGSPMLLGEETEVVRSLLGSGASGWWVPRALVTHCIPPERQRRGYLRAHFTADGATYEWRRRTDTLRDSSNDESDFALRRRALGGELRYQAWRWIRRPEVWIEDLITASVARGQLRTRRWLADARVSREN